MCKEIEHKFDQSNIMYLIFMKNDINACMVIDDEEMKMFIEGDSYTN
jgi:hypothetical protein